MNDYRRVLLCMGAVTQAARLVEFAAALAGPQGAELEALCAPDAIDCEATRKLLRETGARGACRGVPEGAAALAEFTRGADLLVLSQPYLGSAHAAAEQFASQLLLASSCPLLFVPRPQELGRSCGSRVLVAWDGGRQSARALRDALPLLQRAEQVTLHAYGSAEGTGARTLAPACDYLRSHGVQARHAVRHKVDVDYASGSATLPSLGAGIDELLLSDAADLGADLLVMGGYGHSRAREWVLGGVTRSILGSMTLPVFMSH